MGTIRETRRSGVAVPICYTPPSTPSKGLHSPMGERNPRRPQTSSDSVSTVELVALAQHGDSAALDRLFERHGPPLRRWAKGRLPHWARDVADTDDVVQEALLQTFRNIGGFQARGSGSLHAYLRQAVLNRIRDELRRRGRRPDLRELDSWKADEKPSPLDHAIDHQALERYERALVRLKPAEQEAIVARVEMSYTYEELAVSLGKPSADAARKAVKRALVRLVQKMANDA